MGAMAYQITNLAIVYSTVNSCADERKHQSSATLAFGRGNDRCPANSPQKWPVTRKMIQFNDVIMRPKYSWSRICLHCLLIYRHRRDEIVVVDIIVFYLLSLTHFPFIIMRELFFGSIHAYITLKYYMLYIQENRQKNGQGYTKQFW